MLRKPGEEMLSFAIWRQLRNDSNLRGRDERLGLFAFGGKQGLSFGNLDWTGGDSHCSPRTFFRLTIQLLPPTRFKLYATITLEDTLSLQKLG